MNIMFLGKIKIIAIIRLIKILVWSHLNIDLVQSRKRNILRWMSTAKRETI